MVFLNSLLIGLFYGQKMMARFYFFILTIVLTSFTSNDIDVLTVTSIILWFALITKINLMPYLFSVFVAANTSSMEFLIGNLTNIVIGTVFGLPFIEFFIIMIIPTVVTLIAQYFLLRFIFRKQIPNKILNKAELKKLKKIISQPLPYKKKNLFLIAVLVFVVIGSAMADFLPFELWLVTVIGALIILLSNEFNLRDRLRAIPWDVVIFVLVFMVLTNKLQMLGAIDLLANNFSQVLNSVWGGVYYSSFLAAIMSAIINNIPASISLSNVFQTLTANADVAVTKSIAYGLVIGTNLGALLSPVGALATII